MFATRAFPVRLNTRHSIGRWLVKVPRSLMVAALVLMIAISPVFAYAQPVQLTPHQLDELVKRIALYPDPLLAQVLTASTYWDEIPEATSWADEHSYLKGDALAQAIQDDHLQWDPSVLALLPFPSVLDMMARDPGWTEQLGNAVLEQRPAVMDAVQRMRHDAKDYGYLAPNGYVRVVTAGGYIEILPVDPALIYVPYYDPLVVFAPPRPGIVVAAVIHFGPGIAITPLFQTWGWWVGSGFVWSTRAILIDHHPWVRAWANRGAYVHPYAHPWVRPEGPRIEVHHDRK